ncbi:MAG: hypothetical protein QM844_10830 [Planctomycetota bacterium]|nr:hypothetical protein [Planctomycetota bacterium]
MFGIDEISVYLLALGLLALLAAVLIWQTQRSGRTVIVWLAASVLGILLGFAGSYALVRLTGHEVVRAGPRAISGGAPDLAAESRPGAEAPGGGPAGRGGGEGGPRGMGGFGGPREPNPRRDLTALVQKLALLTGEVSIRLTDQQAQTLCACLADLESGESMSSDDAKAKHAEILAILDEKQQTQLDAIGLPRRQPGGPGGAGAGRPAADANPFHQEANAQSLTVLRERVAKQ